MTIGENIRRIRKSKEMTQKDLAAKLETTPQNLAQYENGKRNPKPETLQKIADALGTTVSELTDTISFDIEIVPKKDIAEHEIKTLINYLTKYKMTKEEEKEIMQFAQFIVSKRKKSDPE